MVRKLLIVVAVLGLAAFGVGPAGANLVDFDNLAVGTIDGVPIGPAYPNGVTITSPDGSAAVVLGDKSGFGYISWPNVVTNSGFLTVNPLNFTFDVPRGYIAFVGGDSGGDVDQFTVKLYDIYNTLFYSLTTPVFGGNPIDPNNYMVDNYRFEFTGPGYAKRMEVSRAINAGILIDNLEYCHPTPIPGSLVLLGSGLLGVLGIGIRRKSA